MGCDAGALVEAMDLAFDAVRRLAALERLDGIMAWGSLSGRLHKLETAKVRADLLAAADRIDRLGVAPRGPMDRAWLS